ncbi:MAG: DUF4342 domain-containing protein [Fastidiosipilaceae bacterium]|jgi:NACalpha-BTF3-like transcription factor
MITIDDIDTVMQATKASYADVRAALLRQDGNVALAIRELLDLEVEDGHDGADGFAGGDHAEATQDDPVFSEYTYDESGTGKTAGQKGEGRGKIGADLEILLTDIIEAIQDIWRKGNASRLIIEKDDLQVLNLSLNISIIGVVLAPVVALLGTGAAVLTDYTITIVMDDGEKVSVNKIVLAKKMRREKMNQEESAASGSESNHTEPDASPSDDADESDNLDN